MKVTSQICSSTSRMPTNWPVQTLCSVALVALPIAHTRMPTPNALSGDSRRACNAGARGRGSTSPRHRLRGAVVRWAGRSRRSARRSRGSSSGSRTVAVVLADVAPVDIGAVLALEVHELAGRYVGDHDPHVVDIDRRFDELRPRAPALRGVLATQASSRKVECSVSRAGR